MASRRLQWQNSMDPIYPWSHLHRLEFLVVTAKAVGKGRLQLGSFSYLVHSFNMSTENSERPDAGVLWSREAQGGHRRWCSDCRQVWKPASESFDPFIKFLLCPSHLPLSCTPPSLSLSLLSSPLPNSFLLSLFSHSLFHVSGLFQGSPS